MHDATNKTGQRSQLVQITASTPALDIRIADASHLAIGVNGVAIQKIVPLTSTDLQNWILAATDTLTSNPWVNTNAVPAAQQFFRAMLNQ